MESNNDKCLGLPAEMGAMPLRPLFLSFLGIITIYKYRKKLNIYINHEGRVLQNIFLLKWLLTEFW